MGQSGYLKLFKNKNFLALWLGQIISEFGDRFTQMALIATIIYYAPDITTTASDYTGIFRLTVLLTFIIIPVFLIGPVAGVYVDRWDRRRTMIWSDILRGLLVLLIPFFLIKVKLLLPIYITVFLIFGTTRFFLPAKLGIIPDIAPKENLLLANSLITTTRLIATVLGLGLGGLIVELVGKNVAVPFYIDSITYFLSAMAIMLIRVQKPVGKLHESLKEHTKRIKEIEKNVLQDIIHSIRYIFSNKHIPYVLKTFFLLMSGAGAIYIIFIDFTLKNLTVPSQMPQQLGKIMGFGQFGFIIVFLGIGAFCGMILFGKWGQRFKREKAISSGFLLSGLFLSLFSYTTHTFKNFWLTGIIVIFLGIASAPIIVFSYTLFHESTKDEMRGRVFSTIEVIIHLAFIIFMYLSTFLVTTIKLPEVHILGAAGVLSCIYGLRGLLKKKEADLGE